MNNAANQTRKTTVIDFISVSITSTQKVAFFSTRVSDTVDEGGKGYIASYRNKAGYIKDIYIYIHLFRGPSC